MRDTVAWEQGQFLRPLGNILHDKGAVASRGRGRSLRTCAHNGTQRYATQTLMEMKGEMDRPTVVTGDSALRVLVFEGTGAQINKETKG